MDTFSKDDFQLLLHTNIPLSISLFLSTHPSSAESHLDQITFNSFLQEAKAQLLAIGLSDSAAQKHLELAHNLETDNAFWRVRSDGLAVFLSAAS